MIEIAVAILDIDGTLLDSHDAHAHAWIDALKEFGVHREFSDVRKLIGMGADNRLPKILGAVPEDGFFDKILERRKQIFRNQYLADLKPFAGARALVEKMRRSFITPVVASSAGADELDELLKRAGILDLIEIKATSDDAKHSKPSSDIVKAALAKAGCSPAFAAMVGDTPNDVTAAIGARVKCVALKSGGWSSDSLRDAVAIYQDPHDLCQNFATSIFGRSFPHSQKSRP